jgi:4-diphosphocytidyl-2-C-methyl-D-erythritol kinase
MKRNSAREMKPTRVASVKAFAKLNLGLRVLYLRPDRYHEIRTVFQTISLADCLDISFTPARKTQIDIQGTPEIPDNLVEKAAWLTLEAMRIHGDVRFTLKKNIPAGAGLGGGSSDAAAVLLALPVLAGKALAEDQTWAIAAQLGSDVPFFLQGGTALGLGRGEELYPVPDRRATRGLLVVPGVHSSSAEAYRDLSPRLTSIPLQNKLNTFQQKIWQGGSDGRIVPVDSNDFEEVVFARYPELRRIKQRLSRLGAKPASMTGSGSAIFGIFAEVEQVERARKSFPDSTVFPISFVSRAQYRSAWRRALHLHTHVDPNTNLRAEGNPWPPRSRSDRSQYAQ